MLDQEAGILQLQVADHTEGPLGRELLLGRYRMQAVDMLAVAAADHTLHNQRPRVAQDNLHHPASVLPELHYRHLQTHTLVRRTDVSFARHSMTGHLRLELGMRCRHSLVLGGVRIDHTARADLVPGRDNQAEEPPLLWGMNIQDSREIRDQPAVKNAVFQTSIACCIRIGKRDQGMTSVTGLLASNSHTD